MAAPYRDEEEATTHHDFPILTDDEGDGESETRDLHIRSASEASDPTVTVPVWLRESAKSFKYKWVPLPLRKSGRWVINWAKGPQPPVELKIVPYFPKIQDAPIRLLNRFFPKRKQKAVLLLILYAAWALTWSLMLRAHSTAGSIKGYGTPTNIWCGASFWNHGNKCGLNGNDCRPFSSAHMTFRCPSNCKGLQILENHTVGNLTLRYHELVVGGPDPGQPDSMPVYRGDTFICQAAIHAGVISNVDGGCGVATLVGEHTNFHGSIRNGIESVSFPATFPRSFTFQNLSSSGSQCPSDSQWGLFAVTAVTLTLLSLFTTSPAVFFFSTFFILFLHVGLVSDTPNLSSFPALISVNFSRLLPAAFLITVFYSIAARPLLIHCRAQIEKTILYLGLCFIGALNNYTFAPLIPISRLTPHDLAQPGATAALAIIITLIVLIILTQIHYIRLSGNLPRYLAIYFVIGLVLLTLLLLPSLRLRIHHYIIAIVFFAGTAFPTRPSLIYQGLLLGLFINGVARWGFASIVETPSSLGEQPSDNGDGSGKAWWGATGPNVTATPGWRSNEPEDLSSVDVDVQTSHKNITFRWGPLPVEDGVDGVSMLVNDVERWRGYVDEELYWDQEGVTWWRGGEKGRGRHEGDGSREPEFFRWAWMKSGETGRYSGVGVWRGDGVWVGEDDNLNNLAMSSDNADRGLVEYTGSHESSWARIGGRWFERGADGLDTVLDDKVR